MSIPSQLLVPQKPGISTKLIGQTVLKSGVSKYQRLCNMIDHLEFVRDSDPEDRVRIDADDISDVVAWLEDLKTIMEVTA